jgi:hypothetical protein
MTPDLAFILEDCLQRLDQGETLQACLSHYPEQAGEIKSLLGAAARLQEQVQVRPSAAFRARTQAQLYAHMNTHPQPSHKWRKLPFSVPRLSFALAVLLLAFMLTGTAFAQSALPGAAFYSWKLTTEQIWRAVSPDPLGVDLSLAERRVDEIVAVDGNATAQEISIEGYQHVLNELEKYQGPAVQSRIQQTILRQQQRLKTTGILLVNQKTPFPTDVIPSSTQTPFSTQKTIQVPTQTLIPATLRSTQQISKTKLPPTNLPRIATAVPTILRIPTAVATQVPLPTIIHPLPTIIPPLFTLIPPLPTIIGIP